MSGPTNPTEEYFDKGDWGHDGTRWRKLNLTWGYYDRYVEDLGNLNPGAGAYFKAGTAVPAGEVWVVNAIGFVNATGARGQVNLMGTWGGIICYLFSQVAPATGVPAIITGQFVLKAGDSVAVQQFGVIAGDDLYAYTLGYKMKVT